MRVRKEFFLNPNCAEIHIDKVVTEKMILSFEARGMGFLTDEPVPEFVDKIFCLPGVTKVVCQKYSVGITKGSVFTWDEILPQVVEVLKSTFDLFPEEVTELPALYQYGRNAPSIDGFDQVAIIMPIDDLSAEGGDDIDLDDPS